MTTQTQQETRGFQTQVKQLLKLVTHSLYSNKEIFLRELISNASDAADKLRFEALQDAALFETDPELNIHIQIDKNAHTISIVDNGIGMNRDEVIENLGTIAQSGTKDFLDKLTGDQAKDRNLIGQFGVGFYSAFVVADRVIVKTRRAGMNADQGVYWESTGEGEYLIKNIDCPKRGTEVILHIRQGNEEFLDDYRLRHIISKYSDHIMLPILMKKTDLQIAQSEEELQTSETAPPKKEDEEVVNRATALWTLPKNQIKPEEYVELYKHISHDFEEPLVWSHNKVEGKLEYTMLLYIPHRAPFDLFGRDKRQGLKLYVRRVFIMDDAEQLLPGYLRFVRGIVDSNDLPLNVSREILQNNQVIDSIRAACIKRILDLLDNLAKDETEKYAAFWTLFGQVLKEGPYEDFANKDRIAPLLRFASTHTNTEVQNVSLQDYVKRMPESQKKIYYVTADIFNAAKNSPHLEIFRKKGIEVLLLSDRVDEWLVGHLTEFEGKSLQSVAKGDIDIGGEETENDAEKEAKAHQKQADFESLLSQAKIILAGKVKEVRLTDRLTDSPVCLVSDEQDLSIHLQNMLKSAGQDFPTSLPILEINPSHPVIDKIKTEADEEKFTQWVWVLFNQAQLTQGITLEDPTHFVKQLNQLLIAG